MKNIVKKALSELKFAVRFDARFLRTHFFSFFFNLVPNLYILKWLKIFLLRMTGMKVKEIYVKSPLYVDYAKNIRIGKGTFINLGTYFDGNALTVIGDNCQIGPFCKFENTNHIGEEEQYLPIKIGNNVWIGANCVILPGAVISDNLTIAAGAVVRGEIKEGRVWGGVPAKMLK